MEKGGGKRCKHRPRGCREDLYEEEELDKNG